MISNKTFGIIGAIIIAAIVMALPILVFLGRREDKVIREMKSQPIVYTYTTYGDGVQIPSLASNDLACLKQIKVFYDSFKVGRPKYALSCWEFRIDGDEPVHLLESEDDKEFGNEYVQVARFYVGPKGFERHYVGYVLKTTIHREPYKLPAKKSD